MIHSSSFVDCGFLSSCFNTAFLSSTVDSKLLSSSSNPSLFYTACVLSNVFLQRFFPPLQIPSSFLPAVMPLYCPLPWVPSILSAGAEGPHSVGEECSQADDQLAATDPASGLGHSHYLRYSKSFYINFITANTNFATVLG